MFLLQPDCPVGVGIFGGTPSSPPLTTHMFALMAAAITSYRIVGEPVGGGDQIALAGVAGTSIAGGKVSWARLAVCLQCWSEW